MEFQDIREGQVIRLHLGDGPVDVTIGKVVPNGNVDPDHVLLIPASGPIALPEGTLPPGGSWHMPATG